MSPQLIEKAQEYSGQCMLVGRGHYLMAESLTRLNQVMGIPVVVGSTALATSIFARWEATNDALWSIATGVLAAIVAALGAVQTFLRMSERAEAHKTAGASYGDVRRKLELWIAKEELRGQPANNTTLEELHLFVEKLSHLAMSSPHLPARYYRRAKEERENTARSDFPAASG